MGRVVTRRCIRSLPLWRIRGPNTEDRSSKRYFAHPSAKKLTMFPTTKSPWTMVRAMTAWLARIFAQCASCAGRSRTAKAAMSLATGLSFWSSKVAMSSGSTVRIKVPPRASHLSYSDPPTSQECPGERSSNGQPGALPCAQKRRIRTDFSGWSQGQSRMPIGLRRLPATGDALRLNDLEAGQQLPPT